MNPLMVVAGAMLIQQMLITFASNSVPVLLPPIADYFAINPGLLGVFTSILFGVGIAAAVASGGVLFCCFSGLLVLPGAFGAIVAATGDYDLGFYVAAAPSATAGVILLRRTKK
tara:strand:- start:410 stop:751 length:342 start_codon:yes stop_codon:yes gene_type:complete